MVKMFAEFIGNQTFSEWSLTSLWNMKPGENDFKNNFLTKIIAHVSYSYSYIYHRECSSLRL